MRGVVLGAGGEVDRAFAQEGAEEGRAQEGEVAGALPAGHPFSHGGEAASRTCLHNLKALLETVG
jgi:hypothetical protein